MLAAKNPLLKKIVLSKVQKNTDFSSFKRGQLKTFDAEGIMIDQKIFEMIITGNPNLEMVSLVGCNGCTDFSSLATLKNLREITIPQSVTIADDVIVELKKDNPALVIKKVG